uniref:Uncharacterized protein n=1 Tax=Arundo donax TaxID=35708 RepID=A0A0A9TAI4_ARUDO
MSGDPQFSSFVLRENTDHLSSVSQSHFNTAA